MSLIRKSSVVSVLLGPFVDKLDAVTELGALTPAVKVSRNNAVFEARNSADPVVHVANGWYQVPLNTYDTGVEGRLVVMVQDSAVHLPVHNEYTVAPQNVYDALVAGTEMLDVDAAVVTDKSGFTLSAAGVDALLRTPLVESYALKGAPPTLEQVLFMLLAYLFEKELLGGTVVTKKLDSATEAMRFILSTSGSTVSGQTRQS